MAVSPLSFIYLFYALYDEIVFDGSSLDVLQWVTFPAIVFPLAPVVIRNDQTAGLVFFSLYCLAIFGSSAYLMRADSGVHLFLILVMLSGMIRFGATQTRQVAAWAGVYIAFIVFCELRFTSPSKFLRMDELFLSIVFTSVVASTIILLVLDVRALVLEVEEAETALAVEHARSEALLRSLLPDEITAQLKKRPGEVIADGLPAVTLLFADIVDFTPRWPGWGQGRWSAGSTASFQPST